VRNNGAELNNRAPPDSKLSSPLYLLIVMGGAPVTSFDVSTKDI
jgi:hypothetical protein